MTPRGLVLLALGGAAFAALAIVAGVIAGGAPCADGGIPEACSPAAFAR